MERWWDAPAPAGDGEDACLVVEAKLHDPSAWKLRVLETIGVAVSNATAALLDRIQHDLVVTMDEDDPEKLASADLVFTTGADRAERIAKLLRQVKVDEETGKPLAFTNAYRFIACEPADEPGRFHVTARLALGIWNEKPDRKGGVKRTHAVSLIKAKTSFQQLLAGYYATALLHGVPKALQDGVCQEVAQQVTSYLGQIASAKVKGDVNFPTVEDRDPARRREAYERALDALCRDLRPLTYAKARDVYPGDYAADDARGDKLIVHDERWFAVTRTPDPHPIPLLFTDGKKVRLLEGTARFDACVSKADRHRGRLDGRDVTADRPEQVRRKGSTGLQQWYAAVPILDGTPPDKGEKEGVSRRLDLHLRHVSLQGGGRWRADENQMLVPLEGNRDRFERLLRRSDLEIAWSRLVRKHGDWFLQLTLRVKEQPNVAEGHVLGIAFGLDAIATWHLVDRDGQTVANGALSPNPQILAFLREKRGLEWDQAKGRWIGGQEFGKSLEAIAHDVANRLVELARTHRATLAVEDVSYVQKASRDHEANVLYTAWNYGQLRRILGYKAPLAGLGEAFYASDYVTNLTCPACGASRKPKQDKDTATTYRENGTLHCRACGEQTPVTPDIRARCAAHHGLAIMAERAKRKAERDAG